MDNLLDSLSKSKKDDTELLYAVSIVKTAKDLVEQAPDEQRTSIESRINRKMATEGQKSDKNFDKNVPVKLVTVPDDTIDMLQVKAASNNDEGKPNVSAAPEPCAGIGAHNSF